MQILLSAYIDDEVTPSEAARVEEHLAGCEDCVGELDSLRATSSLLRGLPELRVPRSFALTEAPATVGFAPQLVWTTRFATSLAALFLVVLLLSDVLGFVGQSPEGETQKQAFITAPMPAAPAAAAPAAAPAAALESRTTGLPGPPGNPGLVRESAPAAAAPALAAPAPAAPDAPAIAAPAPAAASALAAPTPAPVAAPAPAAAALAAPAPVPAPTAEPLEVTLESRAMPAAPVQALAAAEAETAVESDETVASQTLAAPAAPEVEEPKIESLAAGDLPPQPVTAQADIDEPVEQTQEAAPTTPLPPPIVRALPAAAVEESAPIVEEPVAEAQMPEVIVPETKEYREFRMPLRELEIALGGLVVLLLAATFWVARRSAGKP